MYYYGHSKEDAKFYEGYWCKGEINDYKEQSLPDYFK